MKNDETKPLYNIYNWAILPINTLHDEVHYVLCGIISESGTGHDEGSQPIMNLNFETNIVETLDAVYVLHYEKYVNEAKEK